MFQNVSVGDVPAAIENEFTLIHSTYVQTDTFLYFYKMCHKCNCGRCALCDLHKLE